ncbi:MAG: hypothetical protein C5B57_10525 [Blastocatellia bacterium]|nr:MAG: hypothetical protein C5B57_10525 [Blastocatellia bacterium]
MTSLFMSTNEAKEPNPTLSCRHRQLEHWVLRGLNARSIARRLQEPEAVIGTELGAVLAQWQTTYGSCEVGLCLATFQEVQRLSGTIADRRSIPSVTLCQAVRLSVIAQDRRVSLLDEVSVRHHAERHRRLPTGAECAKFWQAVRQGTPRAEPALRPVDAEADRRQTIARLLARGLSVPVIARTLHLADTLVDADVALVNEDWIDRFGGVAVGALLVQCREAAETMLVAADQIGPMPNEICRYLREVLNACDREVRLLRSAGVLTAARTRHDNTLGLSALEIEQAVARARDALATLPRFDFE